MAPASLVYTEQAMISTACELKYAKASHLVDIICKDEDIRLLRLDAHLLQDEIDELQEELAQEEGHSNALEKLANEHLLRAQDAEAHAQSLETDLLQREQELRGLQAEKNALQHNSENMSAAVAEKLALTRELENLRPEMEHLKAQAESVQQLKTEKLELERQLSDTQIELGNAKRDVKRAQAKRRNTGVELARETQVCELELEVKKLKAKLKVALEHAEESTQSAEGGDEADGLKMQLAKERKARQKLEEQLEAAQETTGIEDVRKDLLKEKKAKAKLEDVVESLQAELEKEKKAAAKALKRAEGVEQADGEAEELRNELAKEKKERAKAERAAQQAASEFEAQKAALDEKLAAFRTKLTSTKEKLKTTEAELAEAREAAADAAASKTAPESTKPAAAKANTKKRAAAHMDPDATTLGTPGDGPAAKRSRRAPAAVGDKSTFSITPFLNKTTSAIQEEDEAEGTDAEVEASPAAAKKKQPLAQQPASKANVPPKKAAAARKQKMPALEMVTEENEPADDAEQGKENPKKAPTKGQTLKVKTKLNDGPDENTTADPAKKKPKQRKSLADFASFKAVPDVEKRSKKRKLGGLGSTLFDEEEANEPRMTRPLFSSKGFGMLGAKKGGGGLGSSFLGGSRAGTTLLTAGDGSGFQFSPLKKARRNLDDTLRL